MLCKKENLQRLLNPRHVAVIGGQDAATVINECQRIGFAGEIWPVNPNRESLGGFRCFPDVDALPQAPDAVFLAIPAVAAIDVLTQLAKLGAGGVVCYTAGFGASSEVGGFADQSVVDAVGSMALIGPNCYGLINFHDRVALWPFAHGGFYPGFGVAIITQSGMMSSDITMNQRSLPLAYMISAGNQAVLRIEDYIEVLCQRDEVRAIGLHIEGLKDMSAFSRVARLALEQKKPIVVLKTGTSKIGAQLTISHTGSLSGINELYQALFDRLGVVSVNNLAQFVETLKFMCINSQKACLKLPNGNRVMAFTCSGGGATLLADYAEDMDITLPQPSTPVTEKLNKLLPNIADVSNPLDYTTPIWGLPDKLQPVFETALMDGCNTAVLVQDYPLPGLDESKVFYSNDAQAFINATSKAKIPAVICSTLPENIDQQTREHLIANNSTPLQGIPEALNAIASSAWYTRQREFILQHVSSRLSLVDVDSDTYSADEWSSKVELMRNGFEIPPGALVGQEQAGIVAQRLGFPVVVKLVDAKIAHKTELGAVVLGLSNSTEVDDAIEKMQRDVTRVLPDIDADSILVEKMLDKPLAELMVDVRADPQFGLALTLSSGGTLIELFADAVTLLLPVSEVEILQALQKLKIAPLLNGYRGSGVVNKDKLTVILKRLTNYMMDNTHRVAEIEINPLYLYSDQFVVVDALMQLRRDVQN